MKFTLFFLIDVCLRIFYSENVWQILINLGMFVPVGLLMPIVIRRRDKYLWTLIGALLLTLSIEWLQLVRMCGTFEMDDIVNNLGGAGFGLLIYMFINKLCKKYQKMTA